MLAPTDAALGQAVVTLPSLPSLVRQGLNVESGLNDGICVPIFTVALVVASTEAGLDGVRMRAQARGRADRLRRPRSARGRRRRRGVVVLAGRAWPRRADLVEGRPRAAAALAFTAADAVGGSGFIAAFVGGMAFGALGHRHGRAYGRVPRGALGELLGAATFIVFGAVFLGRRSAGVTGPSSATRCSASPSSGCSPSRSRARHGRAPADLAFVGWFGPRGLASIVFAVLIVEAEGTLPHESVLLTTIYLRSGCRCSPTASALHRSHGDTRRGTHDAGRRDRDAFGAPGQLATVGGAGGGSGRLDSISERNSFHGALIRANVFGWRACSSRIAWR